MLLFFFPIALLAFCDRVSCHSADIYLYIFKYVKEFPHGQSSVPCFYRGFHTLQTHTHTHTNHTKRFHIAHTQKLTSASRQLERTKTLFIVFFLCLFLFSFFAFIYSFQSFGSAWCYYLSLFFFFFSYCSCILFYSILKATKHWRQVKEEGESECVSQCNAFSKWPF